MTSKESEQRRVPRISVNLPAVVTWKKKHHKWRASELSEFGVLVTAVRKDQEMVGEDVALELALDPQDAPLPLEGVVAYASDKGIGVRFKNLSGEQHARLRHYVEAHGIGIARP